MATNPNSYIKTKAVPDEVTMQAKLRRTALTAITDDDVTSIVSNLVEKAKKGDAKAAQVVFDYFLGGRLGTQVNVQTNVVSHPASDADDAPPGTTDRVETMRRRAERGEEIFSVRDRQSA